MYVLDLISTVSTAVGDEHRIARPALLWLQMKRISEKNTTVRASVQTSWTGLIARTLTECWLWSGKMMDILPFGSGSSHFGVVRRTRIEQLMTSEEKEASGQRSTQSNLTARRDDLSLLHSSV